MSMRQLALSSLSAFALAACDGVSPSNYSNIQSLALRDGYRELCSGVFARDFPIEGRLDGNVIQRRGTIIREIVSNVFDGGGVLSRGVTVSSYEFDGSVVVAKKGDGTTVIVVCRKKP